MSRSASCLIALVALLAGFLATPDSARAHWENTRWGMTPAQVKALYPGAREEPPPADSSRRAPLLHVDGPIRAGNWEWAAIDFYFERDGKLSSVRLQPVVTNYSSGELYLSIFYGRALEITGTKDPAGRSVAAYSALHRDPKSGDEGTFEVFSLMGAQATSVRIEPADPDRVLRRQAMQRLKLLRDRGEAPLPQGGWSNTRWTMSREQVLALYPTARQDAYGRLHVTGPIAWQGRDWQEVAFDFKAVYGLSAVMLWTSDDALAALEAEATARYGAPVRRYGAPPRRRPRRILPGCPAPDRRRGIGGRVFGSIGRRWRHRDRHPCAGRHSRPGSRHGAPRPRAAAPRPALGHAARGVPEALSSSDIERAGQPVLHRHVSRPARADLDAGNLQVQLRRPGRVHLVLD